jgi:hypothetical protein
MKVDPSFRIMKISLVGNRALHFKPIMDFR